MASITLFFCPLYFHFQSSCEDDVPLCSSQMLRKLFLVNSLPTGYLLMFFMLSADFFQNQRFRKNSFRNTTIVSNS